MAARIRLLTQAAFLALSLAVSFGFTTERHAAAVYHGLHLFPTLSALSWLMLPPLGLFSLAAAAALILGALVAGRLYCSYLCPVGFLQDMSRRLGLAFGLRGRPVVGWTGARLLVLAMSLAFVALGSSAYHYLDHFSNLGRVYGLARAVRAGGPYGWNFGLGLAFLAVAAVIPLFWPRWFCGALCPSGTLFMLLQRAAPLKVRAMECGKGCGQCFAACPTLCLSEGGIDEKLCISCVECVGACGRGNLEFSWRWPWRGKASAGEAAPAGGAFSRREFLAAAGLWVLGAGSAAWLKKRVLTPGPAAGVIPPGGRSAERFLERCIACDACVSVCPTGVLVPAGRESGISGLAQARLDFERAYCSYECNACLCVCPSGALSYFPLETKKRLRIGLSRLSRDLCIPYRFARDCGACQEICPTGAIAMEPFGSTFAPVLSPDYCIGCGACQFACPARPRPAIAVEPAATHSFAFTPRGGRGQGARRPDSESDGPAFPF